MPLPLQGLKTFCAYPGVALVRIQGLRAKPLHPWLSCGRAVGALLDGKPNADATGTYSGNPLFGPLALRDMVQAEVVLLVIQQRNTGVNRILNNPVISL
jgi:hypothetical protein